MSRLAMHCGIVVGSCGLQPNPAERMVYDRLEYRRERHLIVDGVLWTVYEHVMNYDRAARTTLVFDRPGLVRRVRSFPTNWIDLDEKSLFALCDRV